MRTTRTGTMIAGVALLLTACGGGGGDASADGGDGATPAASASIEVEAGDLYYSQESLAATAGEIEFTLVNAGAVEHDLVIEEAGDEVVAFAEPRRRPARSSSRPGPTPSTAASRVTASPWKARWT